jgi:putative transposase
VTAYRFIVSERARHDIAMMCRLLRVSRSGFYDWLTRSPSDRELSNQQLLELIRQIHAEHKDYGAPRVLAELRDTHGLRVNKKRVERLMRQHGLVGTRQRRRVGLTRQDKNAPPAPDLIGRDFAASTPDKPLAPGARMVGDITQLATGEGWLYVADVLDLGSRAVLGYAMADHMRAELVCDAMTMAGSTIGLPEGAIFHSDRGSQYTSALFTGTCHQLGVTRSMGRTGSCFDNSAAEAFWATMKRELGRCWWPTRAQARQAVFAYLAYYNRRRRHSTIGYLTPQQVITNYREQQLAA